MKKKYEYSDDFNEITRFPTIIFTPILIILNFILEFFVFSLSSDLKVTRKKIKTFDNKKIDLYIVEPRNYKEKLPCLVYCHGGGFVKKAGPRHYKLISEYINRAYCKVVYVDYRLAPFYKYPIPVKDCFTAYKYVLNHAEELNIDINRIILGGDSAGGNLALGTSLMARDNNETMPKGLMLVYPVTDRRMQTESMKNFTDTPIWNSKLTKLVWKLYLGQNNDNPIYASVGEIPSLENLPPTYLEVAEFDCLRDEGIELGKKLENYNVPLIFYQSKKTIHGFDKELKSQITRRYMLRRSRFLKGVFGKDI